MSDNFNKVPHLYVWPQRYPHSEAYIIGNRKAIWKLMWGLFKLLFSKTKKKVQLYNLDGESYDLHLDEIKSSGHHTPYYADWEIEKEVLARDPLMIQQKEEKQRKEAKAALDLKKQALEKAFWNQKLK